tara:strand:- start:107 stop:358 length:252 start_codon:yes stop_codon:yes gene_type:complete
MIGPKVIQIREAKENHKLLIYEFKMKYIAVFKGCVDQFYDFEENTWNFEDEEYDNLEDILMNYWNESYYYNGRKYDFMVSEYL